MKGSTQYATSSVHKRIKIASKLSVSRFLDEELASVERFQSPVGVDLALGQVPKLVVLVDSGNNVVVGLNGIAQGCGNDVRSSERAELLSVSVRGVIRTHNFKESDQNTAHNTQLVRVMLVLDTQCNGSTIPSVATDVVVGLNAASGEDAIFWFANRANTSRYKILKDEVFTLKTVFDHYVVTPGYGYTVTDGSTNSFSALDNTMGEYVMGDHKTFDWNVDFESLFVNFSGTDNGIGDIVNYALHLIAYDQDLDAPRVFIQCASKCVYRTERK